VKKVLFIFGTRPEAIKLAPVIREFKERSSFETMVCVTGQHREMLDQVLRGFNIEADFDFDLMRHNQSLTSLLAEIVELVRGLIVREAPSLIVVHGDTTTAMASAIAAFYEKVEVVHVEAGLRTDNISSPFPEEFNRRVISVASSINFCPTERNKRNLIAEGAQRESIFVTGNSAIDALQMALSDNQSSSYYEGICDSIGFDIRNTRYVLVTGHRRENQGSRFDSIFSAIARLTREFSDLRFLYPVHMSPRVQHQAKQHFSSNDEERQLLITGSRNHPCGGDLPQSSRAGSCAEH